MKHLSTLIVSLLLLVAPLNIMAQSKVAHINTQELISEMPEVIAAQNELKKLEDELPQVANGFVQKVRENRVQGAYRQAIKRAKETWQKQQTLHQGKQQPIIIEEVLCLEKGIVGFKSDKAHANHNYIFQLSANALAQLKELFSE